MEAQLEVTHCKVAKTTHGRIKLASVTSPIAAAWAGPVIAEEWAVPAAWVVPAAWAEPVIAEEWAVLAVWVVPAARAEPVIAEERVVLAVWVVPAAWAERVIAAVVIASAISAFLTLPAQAIAARLAAAA